MKSAGTAVPDTWAYAAAVKIHFIRPGKPVENCYVESFNGKFRDECLNDHWFLGLDDARTTIETGEATTTRSGRTARLAT